MLSQHPGISSIVVVGVADSRLTEMVVACIRLEDGWRWADSGVDRSVGQDQIQCFLSAEILRNFCRQKNLTGYFFLFLIIIISLAFLGNIIMYSLVHTCRFKIPKRFILWKNAFPTTTTGKLKRDQVRENVLYGDKFLSSKL